MLDRFRSEVDGIRAADPMFTLGPHTPPTDSHVGQGVEHVVDNPCYAICSGIPFGFDRSGSERAAPYLCVREDLQYHIQLCDRARFTPQAC